MAERTPRSRRGGSDDADEEDEPGDGTPEEAPVADRQTAAEARAAAAQVQEVTEPSDQEVQRSLQGKSHSSYRRR